MRNVAHDYGRKRIWLWQRQHFPMSRKTTKRTEINMASNFKILAHWSSDSLHLRLFGDFDGSSAHELLNFIQKNSNKVQNVLIHTSRLRTVHPFGRSTFQNHLSALGREPARLLYTGDHAEELALYWRKSDGSYQGTSIHHTHRIGRHTPCTIAF